MLLAYPDLCLTLNREGNILKDANPWNILFQGTNPLLVDFTSIMPTKNICCGCLTTSYAHFFIPADHGAHLVGVFPWHAARQSKWDFSKEVALALPYKARLNIHGFENEFISLFAS
jgi:hypothetical protein